MKIEYCEQLSKEWFDLCVGSIGGTRFDQVISGKKNRLIYELLDETLNGFIEPADYVSDDMMYGMEQEAIACDAYSKQSGIPLEKVGMIVSEQSDCHHASPDRINIERGIVVECKSTQNGYIHLQRYFEGPESSYLPQIQNYFAVSDDIKEVHWVSWCPNRPERPLISFVFTRESVIKDGKSTTTIGEQAIKGRKRIAEIEAELNEMKTKFLF